MTHSFIHDLTEPVRYDLRFHYVLHTAYVRYERPTRGGGYLGKNVAYMHAPFSHARTAHYTPP